MGEDFLGRKENVDKIFVFVSERIYKVSFILLFSCFLNSLFLFLVYLHEQTYLMYLHLISENSRFILLRNINIRIVYVLYIYVL